jgi:hypothetical protein
MVEALKRIIRLQAESAADDPARDFERKENALLASLEVELLADGFRPVQVDAEDGIAMDIVPVLGPGGAKIEECADSSSGFEAFQAKVIAGAMTQEAYDELRRRWYGHMDRMKKLFSELRKGRLEAEARGEERRAAILAPQVAAEAALIAEKWLDPKVRSWAATLEKDIMSHLFLFATEGEAPSESRARALRGEPPRGSRGAG